MKSYYIHIPGWVYAMSCYGHDEQDARRRFREAQGFKRLPNGTGVWEKT